MGCLFVKSHIQVKIPVCNKPALKHMDNSIICREEILQTQLKMGILEEMHCCSLAFLEISG